MTDDEALLRAIADHPDEDTPRLAYADYLDEQGGHGRAEFIRAQCELARAPADDPRRGQLHERQARLLEAHRREWLPACWPPSPHPTERWERGFVARVDKQGGRLTRPDADGLAAVPTLEALSLLWVGVGDDEFRLLPPLPNLRAFSLWGTEELSAGSFARLNRWPALRALDLRTTGLTDAGLAHVAALRGLRSLAVGGGHAAGPTDAGLARLAALGDLEELSFGSAGVTGPGLGALAGLPRLRKLVVGECGLTADAIEPLVACRGLTELGLNHGGDAGVGDRLLAALPALPNLRTLHAIRSDVTPAGVRALARLAGLEALAVGGPAFGDEALTGLLSLGGLRRLQLHVNQFAPDGLARLGTLSGLRALHLSYHQRDDRALEGLAGLQQLRWLDIGCNITDAGLGALAGLPRLEVLRVRSPYISDAGLARLKGLPGLRCLGADGCRATASFAWGRRSEWAPQLESLLLNGQTYGPTEWLRVGWESY